MYPTHQSFLPRGFRSFNPTLQKPTATQIKVKPVQAVCRKRVELSIRLFGR